MIVRVVIDNLVIVDHAELEPVAGMTCITGETGAGKTLLIGAINLLFGVGGDAGQVGAGRDHAYVEGEFVVDEAFWSDPDLAALAELRPDGDDTVVLARRVGTDGRTRAMAWGRTISKGDLAAAGRRLVAVAGQHSHRRLLDPGYQREALDRSGNASHAKLLEAVGATWHELRDATAALESTTREAEQLEQRRADIVDALERIEAVDPSPDDERQLIVSRDRARHAADLQSAMARALAAVSGGDGSAVSAIDSTGSAYAALTAVDGLDEQLDGIAAQCLDLQQQLGDMAATLRSQLDEFDVGSLSIDDIEDRLSAYDELKRHYGGTVEAVCVHREELQRQSQLVADIDGALAAARARVQQAESGAAVAATALSASRTRLAAKLETSIVAQLSELGMKDSVLRVAVTDAALAAHGADRVEIRLAPSAALEPRPITDVASGGELSRIALALQVALGAAEAPTMVFDEIDAGIGGHTAHAIAAKLAELATHTQVLCITHLAQVAARADRLVQIHKQDGRTTLTPLTSDEAVVAELCRMMGADPDDAAARAYADQLRTPRFTRSGTTAKAPARR